MKRDQLDTEDAVNPRFCQRGKLESPLGRGLSKSRQKFIAVGF